MSVYNNLKLNNIYSAHPCFETERFYSASVCIIPWNSNNGPKDSKIAEFPIYLYT